MAVACVIPARFQSTRFPGKLLKEVFGKTVLQRTFEQAQKARLLSEIFVATDDERIEAHIRSLGGETIQTSAGCQNGTERIREAFQREPRLQRASLIVNVQGDHPCIEEETIDAVIEAMQKFPSASVATAVSPLSEEALFLSPHIVKCVFDEEKRALYFSRSPIPYTPAGSPITAWGHIGIYAYRPSFFQNPPKPRTFLQTREDLEQLAFLERGEEMRVALVRETPFGVDTPKDLQTLENMLCHKNICL